MGMMRPVNVQVNGRLEIGKEGVEEWSACWRAAEIEQPKTK